MNKLKKRKIIPLALKVETQDDYDECYEMGFNFFQGYYFCEPNIITGCRFDSSHLVIMSTLTELRNPQISFNPQKYWDAI
ncbi:MAG: hypothetical protein WCI88_03410 [Chloroflexota bacterium]